MQNNRILILATIMALISGTIIFSVLKSNSTRVSVLVARKEIPQYTQIEESMIEMIEIHPTGLIGVKQMKKEDIIGQYSLVPIYQGEQFLYEKFSLSHVGNNYKGRLDSGSRGFFLTLAPSQTLGNTLRIGDKIDLIYVAKDSKHGYSFSKFILQNLEILDIKNGNSSGYDKNSHEIEGIVVKVTPVQAETLAYSIEHGNMYVVGTPYNSTEIRTEGVYHENLGF
jgi:Flp pilus assembly protein CpaB